MARGAQTELKVIWSRNARGDQQHIWLFLAERAVAYADKVEARLEERADSIARLPLLGRIIPGTTIRRVSLTDIQYVIDYELDDDSVRILRVCSARENREDA